MLQEYELLKHESEAIRQRILLEHIRTMLPSVQQMADIRERARLNGHFRITYPPDLK
jgi:ATP-dependent Lon protease